MMLVVILCAVIGPDAEPAPCERRAAPVETVAFCPPPTPAVVRPGWRIAAWRCEPADRPPPAASASASAPQPPR